jgi:hypothetical protein
MEFGRVTLITEQWGGAYAAPDPAPGKLNHSSESIAAGMHAAERVGPSEAGNRTQNKQKINI